MTIPSICDPCITKSKQKGNTTAYAANWTQTIENSTQVEVKQIRFLARFSLQLWQIQWRLGEHLPKWRQVLLWEEATLGHEWYNLYRYETDAVNNAGICETERYKWIKSSAECSEWCLWKSVTCNETRKLTCAKLHPMVRETADVCVCYGVRRARWRKEQKLFVCWARFPSQGETQY